MKQHKDTDALSKITKERHWFGGRVNHNGRFCDGRLFLLFPQNAIRRLAFYHFTVY
jgi:hypothetical protein